MVMFLRNENKLIDLIILKYEFLFRGDLMGQKAFAPLLTSCPAVHEMKPIKIISKGLL